MPYAIMSRPVVALPDQVVTMQEVVDRVTDRFGEVPSFPHYLTMLKNTQVATRGWLLPAERVLGPADRTKRRDPEVDLPQTVAALIELAEQAARGALAAVGLPLGAVDCLVTTSGTGYQMPDIGVSLINRLGLRSSIRRKPFAQFGCAGGARALSEAADYIAARPGAVVLVVAADAFSSALQDDVTPGAFAFRGLAGDGAAACVVCSTDRWPGGQGVILRDSFDWVVPGTVDYYSSGLVPEGMYFRSRREAPTAVGDVMEPLTEWLGKVCSERPTVYAVHPGGPLILDTVQRGLGLADEEMACSWDSLRANGNMAGASLLDIGRRMLQTRPQHGEGVLLLAFGPGFTCAAVTGTVFAA